MQVLSVCSSEIHRQLLISVCLRSVGSVFSLLNTHWKLPYPEYNVCSAPPPNLPQACIILDKESEWAYTRYKISSHLWLKLFITFHYSLKSIPIHLPASVRLGTKSPTSFSSAHDLCSLWGGNLFLFAALFPRQLHSLSLPPHLSSVIPLEANTMSPITPNSTSFSNSLTVLIFYLKLYALLQVYYFFANSRA